MGRGERLGSVGPATVKQTAKTGWTPDANVASGFGNHVSAWIHEDKIHAIPNQLGKVGSYKDYYEPGQDPRKEAPTVGLLGTLQGPNKFKGEREIIVGPHESPIEKPGATPVPKNPRILQLHRDRLSRMYHESEAHHRKFFYGINAVVDTMPEEAAKAEYVKRHEFAKRISDAEVLAIYAGLPKEELYSLRTEAQRRAGSL
jgi:hypothetical protein